ncbi:MAG: hypothetical protein M1305_08155, partial [Candidatus Marsarchaeota archaeon]|nr:hypothetical protein [Candidatus Marsarchaeota archaeon]
RRSLSVICIDVLSSSSYWERIVGQHRSGVYMIQSERPFAGANGVQFGCISGAFRVQRRTLALVTAVRQKKARQHRQPGTESDDSIMRSATQILSL